MPVTTTRRKTAEPKTEPRLVRRFREWLTIRDEANQLTGRQETLKSRIKDEIETSANSYVDERGSVWYDLPGGVSFKDHKGKVFKFSALKRERRLIPGSPQPIEDKAITVLKKKRLWLTPAQEKAIQELQIACPFAVVDVVLDVNTFASAVFKGQITDKEYESTLQEQKESFAFIPVEG